MENKTILLNNIDKIHTTSMGIDRIRKNLNLETNDVVSYCLKIIKNSNEINKKGKNFYIKKDNIIITINKNSFTIITVKKEK